MDPGFFYFPNKAGSSSSSSELTEIGSDNLVGTLPASWNNPYNKNDETMNNTAEPSAKSSDEEMKPHFSNFINYDDHQIHHDHPIVLWDVPSMFDDHHHVVETTQAPAPKTVEPLKKKVRYGHYAVAKKLW